MGLRSGEAVPVKGLPALNLSVVAPLLVQSSSATLPNLSRPPLWSSHLAGAPTVLVESPGRCSREERLLTTVVVESPGRVSKKGGLFSGTALGHRPQNRAKGADPRTGTPLRRNVFLPWWPGPFLSCFSVPGLSALGLLGLLSLPICFLSFGLRSCSLRVGRRVKRRGTDPRTGPFEVHLYVRRPGVRSFSSSLCCLLYFIIGGFGLPPLAQTFSSL